jgi:hypothetical protein
MDPETLRNHLAVAEHHVELGAEHLRRQHELISELIRDRHLKHAEMAKMLLAAMEESQELHTSHRDRLRQELARVTRTEGGSE